MFRESNIFLNFSNTSSLSLALEKVRDVAAADPVV
jgi:hypothetical protein